MRTILLNIVSCLGCTALVLTQKPHIPSTPLFLIWENNKVGYIDKEGKVVLPAIYLNGGEFSEGLAPVRIKGRYGFIDGTGRFVISPKFDWAEPFTNGLAIVYEAGQPYFIDHTGHSPFPCNYVAISPFSHGLARVASASGKMGLINRSGQLVVDTIYNQIGDFHDGLSTVAIRDSKREWQRGVIDTMGHVVVRPGIYNDIRAFREGYAVVELDGNSTGVIDRKGRLLSGFVDTHDQLLLHDPTIKDLRPFGSGRSFIKREDDEFCMIDTRMRTVGTQKFSDVDEQGFINGYALVRTAAGWGIVDTNARFVVRPAYDEIDQTGFINGLLKVMIHEKLSFVNTEGKVVWQSKNTSSENNTATVPPALSDLNVDHMMRGYFYAYSSPENTDEEIRGGGWAISHNFPQKLSGKRFKANNLSITIDIHTTDTFARSYNGFPVYLANMTKDTCQFHAQDSRLYMQMQALDGEGKWKDIDYLPSSWCGNSYHVVSLEPGAYWKFVIPKFEGDIRTKLRIELQYIDALHPKEDKVIYSNIIDGTINPGQLWNKEKYYPQGIMDPYND